MHIGIDTLGMNVANSGGLHMYTLELIRALAFIDKENKYFIFIHRDNFNIYEIDQKNFFYIKCPISQAYKDFSLLWREIFFSSMVRRFKIDVLHSPENVIPCNLSCPSVVTLHDLISFREKFSFGNFRNRLWSILVKRGVKRARAIITVSHASKLELLKQFNFVKDKVTIIYNGCPIFLNDNKENKLPVVPYILWVGKTLLHKNIIRLIRAYNILIKTKSVDHSLFLVGMKGGDHQEVVKEIKSLGLSDKVLFLEPRTHEELMHYYTHASLFVFPSLIEGFGFPILEAMLCGTPVVTSNRGATEEISGDAAYLVDPENREDIADGMWKVLNDVSLRQRLIEKGYIRAKQFSWEVCARQTLEVYKKVLKEA